MPNPLNTSPPGSTAPTATRPYILLDEYDTPLHSAHLDKYYNQMIAFIRSFMVQTFKDNPHLKQAVLIGILKICPGEYI